MDNQPGSPHWWVRRLETELAAQRPIIDEHRAWYDGRQSLAHVSDRCRPAYRFLLERARRNWASLCIDAAADRLFVEGFEFSEPGDSRPWDIWQDSGMDAESTVAMLEALTVGRCPILVSARPDGTASITIEDPAETIVGYAPGDSTTPAAALKLFRDLGGSTVVELAMPGVLHRWTSDQRTDGTSVAGHLWRWQYEELPGTAMVPIVELRANARIGRPPRPELDGRLDALRGIDKLVADMLVAAEYGAFRQRWVTGLELEEDETGNPIPPFRSAIDALFVGEDPDIKFGEFAATDLGNYVTAIESTIQHLAAITKTPPHYLLSGMTNLSADAIRAAEAGLVTRVRRHQRAFGEAWEQVIRLALAIEGDTRSTDTRVETQWRSPETRTQAELADALLKLQTIGIPDTALWRMWGATPQEIDSWRAEATRAALLAPGVPLAATPTTTPV